MRDYALTCAAMNGQIGTSPLSMLRNWWQRHQLMKNPPLDCSAEDLRWMARLPLSVDPESALADRLSRCARGLKG